MMLERGAAPYVLVFSRVIVSVISHLKAIAFG